MNRTVVVAGAGVGGLSVADRLRAILPERDRIVLVDRSFDGTLGLSLLWVLRGWRNTDEVRVRPTAAALPGVEFVAATIESIDTAGRGVRTDIAGVIGYDALVIALGAELDTAKVPGLAEALASDVAGQFYTLDGAARLHDLVQDLKRGRVVVLVGGVPFKCPAAPFEAALLIADQLGDRHSSGAVWIDTFTPDPLPMPVAGPEVGKALVGMLESRGVGFHPGKTVTAVDAAARTLRFADGGSESFDLLAVVPPHAPTAAVVSTELALTGWIPVDPATLATTASGVWAIGDTTVLTLPNGKPLPKAAVFAKSEAEVVAYGVARHLGYEVPELAFTGEGACYVEVGGHEAAKGAGNFLNPPAPSVTLHEPSREFHEEKAAEEREWIARWNTVTP
ncbi:NAD(P)/FAD-dependent oxidoreductase [Mycobacterium simiae]|uniref:NAD(P)/FAD-dependent oxidoreductase n=1 Tax=Mycobacterium simiae TaxID=1784 RepID=A0A5B1BK75_MYCSI|nr:FAD/NAD(P)-binding oxidoreductase [Mycobacterium simiae]KAA1248275.1 NAD(P)/FAD-dependent oxidoreductase [Mycobacterium simiae]